MYLVGTEIFRDFIGKKGFLNKLSPIYETPPCIIEFRSGNIVSAKVEVMSWGEFKSVIKFGNVISKPRNKYWIRGDEWDKDENGNPIEKLSY